MANALAYLFFHPHRANLRRVMLDQKNYEKVRLKSELEMNEQEKEARLETLRRLGRRRLGLDLVSLLLNFFLPLKEANQVRVLGPAEPFQPEPNVT